MAFIGVAVVSIIITIIEILAVCALITALILLIVGIIGFIRQKRNNNGQPCKRRAYPVVCVTIAVIILLVLGAGVVAVNIFTDQLKSGSRQSLFSCLIDEEYYYAEKLLKDGADVETEPSSNNKTNEPVEDGKETLLIHFSYRQNGGYADSYVNVVEFLIKNGADVNRREYTHEPDHENHSGSAEHGYQWGDRCGMTPLMAAARSGNIKTARLLIANGADVNAADYCGKTVLMYAGAEDCNGMAELLIEHGADINAVDNFGQTAYDHAEHYGSKRVMAVLIDAGK